MCDNCEFFDVLFVIENKCFSWKYVEELYIWVDLLWIIVFLWLIKKIGRFILWLKGVINYIGMWFDSSDLFNFNNNLRMDLNLIY